MATTREWRNSFIHINRIPSDVLSLIPTHLASQDDRFRASFVCRHWRRTFLQHAVLWTQIHLSKGELYVKTMLERAKGSVLEVATTSRDPAGAVALLPPYATQMKFVHFGFCHWKDIQRFSEINSGPLPLLCAIRIDVIKESHPDGPDTMTPPSLPLFHNAADLRVLVLHSEGSPFLNHFIFPNLTNLQLSATPTGEGFRALQLLDFMEASPMLRTFYVKVVADILLDGIPQERIVVLPNVEIFSLVVSDGATGYEMAAHLSCPSMRHASIMHERGARNATPREMFPTSVLWHTILRQFTNSPVGEVALEIRFARNPIISCSMAFRSLDTAVLSLGFQVAASVGNEDELQTPFEELHYEVFHQASRTIQDLPLLANVKNLIIDHRIVVFGTLQFPHFSAELGRLFQSLGHLEMLITCGCDLHLYFNSSPPSPNPPGFYDTDRPVALPPIRDLAISHPSHTHDDEMCAAIIVELARSRHALGVPLRRLSVCMERLPTAMAEKLDPWASEVGCYEEMIADSPYF